MNQKQFIETYCHNCGTQRCEGPGTEWFEGCPKRWNLDGMDPATEIKRLDNEVMKLSKKIVELNNKGEKHGKWIIERKHWPSNNPYMDDNYYAGAFCSECGFCVDSKTASFGYPHLNTTLYFSACGTKMDKG